MIENLVATLVAQHNNLRREMVELKNKAKEKSSNFPNILNGLNEFKKSLFEHLDLENNIFYPKILEKLENLGSDTTDTRRFISEMKTIEKSVISFLKRYNNVQKIEKNFEKFRLDLSDMIITLLIRIDSEEQGIYLYWEL